MESATHGVARDSPQDLIRPRPRRPLGRSHKRPAHPWVCLFWTAIPRMSPVMVWLKRETAQLLVSLPTSPTRFESRCKAGIRDGVVDDAIIVVQTDPRRGHASTSSGLQAFRRSARSTARTAA